MRSVECRVIRSASVKQRMLPHMGEYTNESKFWLCSMQADLWSLLHKRVKMTRGMRSVDSRGNILHILLPDVVSQHLLLEDGGEAVEEESLLK